MEEKNLKNKEEKLRKKLKNKKQNGITLIALVVTIVILLILASISIGALTGDKGIIDETHTAKENTEIASWEEQIDLAIIDAENKHRDPSMSDIKEELKNKGIIDDYSQVDDKTGAITTNEPTYTIEGKLNDYIEFGPGIVATKNEEYTDETSKEEYKTVTVPEGFQILPGASEIDKGLVIKDKNGSQFVWIPVSDINEMAQCSTAGGNCNLVLEGNELKCTEHNSTEIVGKLYATALLENFGTVNTTYNANSGLREPAVVTNSSSGTGTSYDGDLANLSQLGYSTTSEFLSALKTQYKEMAISVAKYKGFYVGRYELGLEGDTPVSKNASTDENKDKVVTTDAGSSSLENWYGLYKKCLEYTVPETNNSSVTSSMIWGSQYDAMMNWMKSNNIDVKSTADGTNTIRNSDSSRRTGAQSKDFLNNIYDLFGCHYEWTLEASSSIYRVYRGGLSVYSDSPSYRNIYSPAYAGSNYSSRLTLYIK